MPRPPRGFTLLEVLIATVVVTVGLLALAGTLGLSAALAGRGRAQGQAAILLQSRADQLRQQVGSMGPLCLAPPSGSRELAPGRLESWTASVTDRVVELVISVGEDTLVTRMGCP